MRNLNMRQTAPPVRSRIPVVQPGHRNESVRHQSAPSAELSRLEMMQNDFQQKLLLEKEQKMISIYEQNQHQAMRKVSGKEKRGSGIVRDFFRERRQLEQKGNQLLARDVHFKQKKLQRDKQMQMEDVKNQQMVEYRRKLALQQQAQQQLHLQQQQWEQQHLHQHQQQEHQQYQQQQRYPQQQMPTRSKPLAPIKSSTNRNNYRPPSPDGMYETSEQLSVVCDTDIEAGSEPSPHLLGKNHKPMRASAKLPLKPIRSKTKHEVHASDMGSGQREQRITQNVRNRAATLPGNGQRKVLFSQRKTISQPILKEKLTDFQKWQMEQDQQRTERLEQHKEKQNMMHADEDCSVEYDHEKHEQTIAHQKEKEYNDIKAKEAELEALIAKHQAQLDRLQSAEDELDNSARSHQTNQAARPNQLSRQSKIDSATLPHQENSSVMSQVISGRSEPTFIEEPHETFSKKPKKVPQRKPAEKQPQKCKPPSAPRVASPPPLNAEVSFYAEVAENRAPSPDIDLKICPNCGRKFAAERVAKHTNACKKQAAAAKKRTTFDMTKHRTEGTEIAAYVRHGEHLKEKTRAKKSNWRNKHEDLIRTVKNARVTQDYVNQGGNLADLPPPPPSENLDYKQCPWCSRRFDPGVAIRHIPRCKDIKSRPRPPPKAAKTRSGRF